MGDLEGDTLLVGVGVAPPAVGERDGVCVALGVTLGEALFAPPSPRLGLGAPLRLPLAVGAGEPATANMRLGLPLGLLLGRRLGDALLDGLTLQEAAFVSPTMDTPILLALSVMAPAAVQVPVLPVALIRTSTRGCKDGGQSAGKGSTQEGATWSAR